jgi:HSP20 family protein
MADNKELTRPRGARDPFALFREITSELDRAFDQPFWPSFRHSPRGTIGAADTTAWCPKVDVFEKDNRLVTRVDLPGVNTEDVSVEVTDGHLALSGERKRETEDKKGDFYRSEREYGSFFRTVPLPDGVKLEDVKASFADGVLEVSVPLPARPESKVRKVEIQEPAKTAKTAA